MRILGVLAVTLLLTGCIGSIWTGASLLYNRHTLYKQFDDFQLGANANRALYQDEVLRCAHCALDLEVFNRDILLAGHLPNDALRQIAINRVGTVKGYRRLFKQLSISDTPANTTRDGWITLQIKAKIIADAGINPKKFKVVTADRIVYLMGDVDVLQSKKVIDIARKTSGVRRVVKLFKYYHLTDKLRMGK